MGVLEHVDGHLRRAAELPRQRPFGAGAVAQDAAEDLGVLGLDAPGGARDLLDLGLAIDREQAHAELEGARDVALLLDRVAEGDAVGRGAGGEHHLDLGDRGGVEAGAEQRQRAQDLGRGIGLDGVEHARVGQRPGELGVVAAHDLEVEHHAGPVLAAALQEFADALRHGALPSKGSIGREAPWLKVQAASRPAQRGRVIAPAVRWRHDERRWALRPRSCLCLEGRSPTARRARWTSLFSRRTLETG